MAEFRIIGYVAGFVIACAVVWYSITYFEDVGYQRAANHYEGLIADAAKESLRKEREMQAKADEANKRSIEREKQFQVELSVADSQSRRLRYTIDEYKRRLPTNTGDAGIEAAHTVAELYATCIGEYQAVARAADGHSSDALTLSEAWPK